MRAAVPIARVIYIEPDIFDPDYRVEDGSAAGAAAGSPSHAASHGTAGSGAQVGPDAGAH